MKPKTINWKEHASYPDVIQGMIGEQEVFTITKDKKKDTFTLVSWPLKTECFHQSTATKNFGNFNSIAEAETLAENKWKDYILSLMNDTTVELQENDKIPGYIETL